MLYFGYQTQNTRLWLDMKQKTRTMARIRQHPKILAAFQWNTQFIEPPGLWTHSWTTVPTHSPRFWQGPVTYVAPFSYSRIAEGPEMAIFPISSHCISKRSFGYCIHEYNLDWPVKRLWQGPVIFVAEARQSHGQFFCSYVHSGDWCLVSSTSRFRQRLRRLSRLHSITI
jgi:hypothetical protein